MIGKGPQPDTLAHMRALMTHTEKPDADMANKIRVRWGLSVEQFRAEVSKLIDLEEQKVKK